MQKWQFQFRILGHLACQSDQLLIFQFLQITLFLTAYTGAVLVRPLFFSFFTVQLVNFLYEIRKPEILM